MVSIIIRQQLKNYINIYPSLENPEKTCIMLITR